ncbi:hypothetical protein NP493_364g01047 [Ridgeia piscesae]|uniref:Uncharacterized protein n=1 Tax=Ridgeia piscesae TaxID=27915 RepID=A0AAD9L333_RIDPI|nr:hypothetical protein NP493_364g01047 [Ridgeia piscesae]
MGGKVSVPRKIRIGRRKKKDDKAAAGDSDAPTAVVGEEGDAAPVGGKGTDAERGNGVEAKESAEKPAAEEKQDKPEVESAAEKPPEKVDGGDAAKKPKPGVVVVTEVVEIQAVQSKIDGRSVDENAEVVKVVTPVDNATDVQPEPSTSVVEKVADVPLEQPVSAVDAQPNELAKVEETAIAPMSEVMVETTHTTTATEEPAVDKSADKTETPAAVKSDEKKQVVTQSEPESKTSEPAVAAAASAAEIVATAAVVDKPTEPSTSAAEPPPDVLPEVVQLSPKEKLEEIVPFDFEKFPFDNVVFQGAVRGRTLATVGAVRVRTSFVVNSVVAQC